MVSLDVSATRGLLQAFNFHALFAELPGWDHHTRDIDVPFDNNKTDSLIAIAHKRDLVAFERSSREPLSNHADCCMGYFNLRG